MPAKSRFCSGRGEPEPVSGVFFPQDKRGCRGEKVMICGGFSGFMRENNSLLGSFDDSSKPDNDRIN